MGTPGKKESVLLMNLERGVHLLGFKSYLCVSLTVRPWARAQKGTLAASSQACGEDEIQQHSAGHT